MNESVEIIEMMYKTNFIVLVLSSARHKVVIWDDHERKNRTEITFNSVVKAVKLRKDMMVIVLENKTFIFSFLTLQLIEQVETGLNAGGLCGISTNEAPISKIIAVPNPNKGSIKVLNYVAENSMSSFIQAHETDLGALSVNPDGTLIASASQRGTVIKIHSADGGETL